MPEVMVQGQPMADMEERAVPSVPSLRPHIMVYRAQYVCRLRPAGILWGSLWCRVEMRYKPDTQVGRKGNLCKMDFGGGLTTIDKLCQPSVWK